MRTTIIGARSLYEEIVEGGFAWIENCLSELREESNILDFKEASLNARPDQSGNGKDGKVGPDDRKNLSEALSGFANTDGGVIVWGIKCRRNAQGLDVASELKPIALHKAFMSNLQSQANDQVSAIVGVEFQTIPDPSDESSGYVVMFVPSSPTPVMARNQESWGYHYRSGTSFRKMEHRMIADAFARRSMPELELVLIHSKANRNMIGQRDHGGSVDATIDVFVYNHGKAIARYPAVGVSPQAPLYIGQYSEIPSNFTLDSGIGNLDVEPSGRMYSGGPGKVIHSGTFQKICTLVIVMPDYPPPGYPSLDYAINYSLRHEFGSEQATLIIPKSELEKDKFRLHYSPLFEEGKTPIPNRDDLQI